jgi:hypothetical protein
MWLRPRDVILCRIFQVRRRVSGLLELGDCLCDAGSHFGTGIPEESHEFISGVSLEQAQKSLPALCIFTNLRINFPLRKGAQ